MHQPLDCMVVKLVASAITAASDTDSSPSDPIDMSGYDSVIFATSISDSVATGVAGLKVQGGDSTDSLSDLDGASASATSAADDDLNGTTLQIGMYRPTKRYLLPVRTSATAAIAFGDLFAILIPRLCPPPTDETIADLVKVNS